MMKEHDIPDGVGVDVSNIERADHLDQSGNYSLTLLEYVVRRTTDSSGAFAYRIYLSPI